MMQFDLQASKDTAPLVCVTHKTGMRGGGGVLFTKSVLGGVYDGLVGEAQLVRCLYETHSVAPHVQQHLQYRAHVTAAYPLLYLYNNDDNIEYYSINRVGEECLTVLLPRGCGTVDP